MTARSFFYRETEGIRVTVRPVYLRDHSEPSQSHYVFAYFVRIENVGTMAAQLLKRRWLIHDSVGDGVDTEVIGEGVVGEQPTIMPERCPRVSELLHSQVRRRLDGRPLRSDPAGRHVIRGRDPALHPERERIDEPAFVVRARQLLSIRP